MVGEKVSPLTHRTNSMSKQQTLEIVERSSGFWVVDDCGVAWDQPFDSLDEALKKLEQLEDE